MVKKLFKTWLLSNDEMKHVREVLQLMSQLTGDDRFTSAIGEFDRNGEEGGIKTMRSAIGRIIISERISM